MLVVSNSTMLDRSMERASPMSEKYLGLSTVAGKVWMLRKLWPSIGFHVLAQHSDVFFLCE